MSKTWSFADINYAVASDDDQLDMFMSYSSLLNSLPTDAAAKITINNKRINKEDFTQRVLLSEQGDGLDHYRQSYNEVQLNRAVSGRNQITQEKYITLSVPNKNIDEARAYFRRAGNDIDASLTKLSSKVSEISGHERLRILHDFYRQDNDTFYYFDLKESMQRGHDFKDMICPDSLEFKGDHFRMGDRYGRVLFIKDFATYIKDSMIGELCDLPRNLMLSIDIIPIATDKAIAEVTKRLMAVEGDITRWQRRQNNTNNFSAVIPYEMEQMREEVKELLDDLTKRDQRLMFTLLSIVHTAPSWAELQTDTESLQAIGRKYMCNVATLKYQQEDALNTALPFGLRRIDALRTLTTESTAAMVPFTVQEIQHKGGIAYGINAISRNMIMCNRKELQNPGGFIFGVSGSGKGMTAKQEIIPVRLSRDIRQSSGDRQVIIDPDGEYGPLVEALGGTVVKLGPNTGNYVSAFDAIKSYAGDNIVIAKSEFALSLCEQVNNGQISPRQKSIIDRCVANIFRPYLRGKSEAPTLRDFWTNLKEQKETEAHDLALSMELYADGSLDMFAQQTNVDLDNPFICFDLRNLGANLKTVGMVVVIEAVQNIVNRGYDEGQYTWIWLDELDKMMEHPYSAAFLAEAYRRYRKRRGIPTGITQNPETCLKSEVFRTMLGNSEFIIMLNQAAADRVVLADLLHISSTQLSFITNAEVGQGLMRVGGSIIPFSNSFPTNNALYKLMSTKPSDFA